MRDYALRTEVVTELARVREHLSANALEREALRKTKAALIRRGLDAGMTPAELASLLDTSLATIEKALTCPI